MMRDELDRYDELVLTCDGEDVVRLTLTPALRTTLASLWDVMERELGRRVDLDELIAESCRRVIARSGS